MVSSRAAIEAAFCRVDRVTLAGSMTPAANQILVLAGSGVESDIAPSPLRNCLDDDATFESSVDRDLTEWLFHGRANDVTTGLLVIGSTTELIDAV